MSRIEDSRLVTGAGRFAADWSYPDQLYASFVRSDRAHADIDAIDVAPALSTPGVRAVFTGEDVARAGFASLPTGLAFDGIGGQALRKPPRPALAQGRVRYVGEPVACIVAETSDIAADAAAVLDIRYRDREAVIDTCSAVAAGAVLVHDDVPRNVCFEFETGDASKTQAAFASAHRTARLELRHQRLVANPMEPRACVVRFDAASGNYTLNTNTQGVNALRAQLAAVTGLTEARFRIQAQDVGGGFGVRYNAYPEHCVLLIAATRLGRPVKWVASRAESFVSDEQGRGVESEGEAALDESGRFLALRFRFVCDMGAYLSATGPFIDIQNVLETLSGVYRVPALYARFELVMTNTVPVAAYRGAGRPLASYMVERLVEQAARVAGIDPVTLRRRNFIPRDALPYQTPHAGVIDCGDFDAVMERALQACDWYGFPARRELAGANGKLRGIGIATYIEFSSPGFYPKDEVEIRFGEGAQITLHAVTQSSGQSHETTFAQIVSAVLGLAPDGIVLRSGDPDIGLIGSATGGSRSLFGVGSVFKLAAQAVVQKGLGLAAAALGAMASEIEFDCGIYRVRASDRQLPLETLIARHAGAVPHPLDVRMEAKFGGNYPNGCHVAEVEIDPDTGMVSLMHYTAVDDCGTVINPMVVEGQVIGGVAQGAGQALLEEARYDANTGQLLSGSFMDYAMPRAGLIKAMVVLEHPVPTALNPLGAKGVGEAGATGAPPAVMNAVLDALRCGNVRELDSPATPPRVWQALRDARVVSE